MQMRRIISKFAVPVSMILWIIIFIFADEDTSSLPFNSEHGLTQDRSYIVNPMRSPNFRLPTWAIFAAIIPAAIITLLVSVQHLVSIHLINKKLKVLIFENILIISNISITEGAWIPFGSACGYCYGWGICLVRVSMDTSCLGAIISSLGHLDDIVARETVAC